MRKHDQGSEVPFLDVYSPKYKNLIIRYSKSLLFAFGFLSARFPAPSPALEMEHPVKVELRSILSEPLLKPLQIPEVSYVFSRLIPVFYVFRGLPFPCLRMPVNKCKVTALVMAISWHVGPIEIRGTVDGETGVINGFLVLVQKNNEVGRFTNGGRS